MAAKLFAFVIMTLIMRETGSGRPWSAGPEGVGLLAGVFVHRMRLNLGLGGGAPRKKHAPCQRHNGKNSLHLFTSKKR